MIRQIKYFSSLSAVMALSAESKKDKAKEDKSSMLLKKPSQLPLYEEPEDLYRYEYFGKEKTKFEEGVSVVRQELQSAYKATSDGRDSIKNLYETGKAHSMATVDYISDEENVAAKVGAISVGGLLGLLIGGRRKGLFKKLFYTSVGATGVAAFAYPKEASKISRELYDNAGDYSLIAYNFVAGVKPQNDSQPSSVPEDSKKTSSSAEKESSVASSEKSAAKDVVVNFPKEKQPPTIQGDIGQSNPDDKDLYTTRS